MYLRSSRPLTALRCIVVWAFTVPTLAYGQTGDIQVTCEPAVRIYLDDAFQGVTTSDLGGLYIEGIAIGGHTVRIAKQGFRTQSFDVQVLAGRAIELTIQLLVPAPTIEQQGESLGGEVSAKVGALRIRSVPIQCAIEFLGELTTKTMDVVTIDDVAEGDYPIVFSRPNSRIETVVHVSGGRLLRVLAHFPTDQVVTKETWPPTIAFFSDSGGRLGIYTLDPDRRDRRMLLCQDGVQESFLAWSPDGEHIAFISDRDESTGLDIMAADGSGLRRLTRVEGEVFPSWSPDGRKITFNSSHQGQADVYATDVDGSGLTRLTRNHGDNYLPSWSPDGEKIVFMSERAGDSDVYVMRADGSDLVRLTREGAAFPSWSPDGEKIAFISDGMDKAAVSVMDADGSDPTALTSIDVYPHLPRWSPDGARIAFASERGDIYVVDLAGGRETSLVQRKGHLNHRYPEWSPDGGRIAFHSFLDVGYDIYIVDVDGSDLTRLTQNAENDFFPVWSPVVPVTSPAAQTSRQE